MRPDWSLRIQCHICQNVVLLWFNWLQIRSLITCCCSWWDGGVLCVWAPRWKITQQAGDGMARGGSEVVETSDGRPRDNPPQEGHVSRRHEWDNKVKSASERGVVESGESHSARQDGGGEIRSRLAFDLRERGYAQKLHHAAASTPISNLLPPPFKPSQRRHDSDGANVRLVFPFKDSISLCISERSEL